MAKVQIEPKVLKGFRDQLPEVTIPRQEMIRKIERVFGLYGFAPIDTPALEYSEILLGKGSAETDKQLFRFTDNGGRDVALRFDLTVPLARFIAMHVNELGTPFKRFHIAPVWRAEKPQRGRYREFIQCDIDIIGTDSLIADAEILTVIHHALKDLAIRHCFRINNRVVLNGLLHSLGAEAKRSDVLRAMDKLEKLGEEVVSKELMESAALTTDQVAQVLRFLAISRELGNDTAALLSQLKSLFANSELGTAGVAQLERLREILVASGVSADSFRIDLSIARGLDYYTGLVFETTFLDLPEIGSISSGGRYDDLASIYINRKLPGVGASIGLDRILAALEELDRCGKRQSTAMVLVALVDEPGELVALQTAQALRSAEINVEVYPERTKLGNQLKYADRKGIPLAVIIGEKELASKVASLKDLRSGEQRENVPLSELPQAIRSLLQK